MGLSTISGYDDGTGCSECNPSSPRSHESNANVENEADTSSLEFSDEWLLLLPAAGTKAPLSHTAQKHSSTLQMRGTTISNPGQHRFNNWGGGGIQKGQMCESMWHTTHSPHAKSLVKCLRIPLN